MERTAKHAIGQRPNFTWMSRGGRFSTGSGRPLTVHTTFTLTLTLDRVPLDTVRAMWDQCPRPHQNSSFSQAHPHAPARPGPRKSPFKQRQTDATLASRRYTDRGREGRHTFKQTNKLGGGERGTRPITFYLVICSPNYSRKTTPPTSPAQIRLGRDYWEWVPFVILSSPKIT